MPEGDTIFRAAATLRRWLVGRTITAARSQRVKVSAAALVGQEVAAVDAKGKHLLIRFQSGRILHTHMQMTGSWHVYRRGERWRKPSHLARLVLESDERLAVCFDAPVIEIVEARDEAAHPALSSLGPDVLVDPFDLDEVRRRARSGNSETPIGVVLLDQQVVAGIGNIFRCEALFRTGLDPWAAIGSLDDDRLDGVVAEASRLMRANIGNEQNFGRDTGAGPDRRWVYGRTGRPCLRCRTAVRSEPLGDPPRTIHWCPVCQAPAEP